MNNQLSARIRLLDDQQWLDLLIRSIEEREIDGVRFPGFPDQAVQRGFVGSANEPTLREAFSFYCLVKGYAAELGMPIGEDRRFLDFGMGWGRFLRFLWKDVSVSNLYGCDVDPDIIQTARDLGVPGNLDRLYAYGKLPYPDGFLQGAMAYSVFTHLPEPVHRHWLLELARVMQPGAVFSFTVEPQRFVDFIESVPNETSSDWHRALHAYAAGANEFRAGYDRGELVYIPTGGGDFRGAEVYGDAMVPLSYIEANWAPYFVVRAYIDDPNRFWQAVAVVQRI
jgi:trans-aconitate methyltransferase